MFLRSASPRRRRVPVIHASGPYCCGNKDATQLFRKPREKAGQIWKCIPSLQYELYMVKVSLLFPAICLSHNL